MKIEKLNENQICCILTGQDLKNNQLKISEFAQGTEKARAFFHNIMIEAKDQTGFDMEGASLMIEAVPQLPDSLKLIITKVHDENGGAQGLDNDSRSDLHLTGADSFLTLLNELKKARHTKSNPAPVSNAGVSSSVNKAETGTAANSFAMSDSPIEAFRFSGLENVIAAAKALDGIYTGKNALYKDGPTSDYLLIMHSAYDTPMHFNKICNILSEYSTPFHSTKAAVRYLEEHGYTLLPEEALGILAKF